MVFNYKPYQKLLQILISLLIGISRIISNPWGDNLDASPNIILKLGFTWPHITKKNILTMVLEVLQQRFLTIVEINFEIWPSKMVLGETDVEINIQQGLWKPS